MRLAAQRSLAWGGLLGTTVGSTLGYAALHGPAYTSTTPLVTAWLLAAVMVVLTGSLAAFRRSRWAAIAAGVSAVALLVSCYAVLLIGYTMGLEDWSADKLVPVSTLGWTSSKGSRRPQNNRMQLTAPLGATQRRIGGGASCAFAHRRRS